MNALQKQNRTEDHFNQLILIWIDQNINSPEYQSFLAQFGSQSPYNNSTTEIYPINTQINGEFDTYSFTNIQDPIQLLKTKNYRFYETIIIISGSLFVPFVREFQNNLKDIFVIPKIVVFSSSKAKIPLPGDIQNQSFYHAGGVCTNFEEIKKYINQQIIRIDPKDQVNKTFIKPGDKLIFDQVTNWKDAIFPLFYTKFFDESKPADNYQFIKNMYMIYSKEVQYNQILNTIINIPDIPVELLSKYYLGIYTINGSFYGNMKRDLLDENSAKMNFYLPFIKTIYTGLKKGALKQYISGALYSAQTLSPEQITELFKYKQNRKAGLPLSTLFSRGFISFTKDIAVAQKFLANKNALLTIVQSQEQEEISAHADIEDLSYFGNEKEVLFFPFAIFGVDDFVHDPNGKAHEVKLIYMGNIRKQVEENIKTSENEYVPNNRFKQIVQNSGLVSGQNKTKMQNMKIKDLSEKYEIKKEKKTRKKLIIIFVIVVVVILAILIPVLAVTHKSSSNKISSKNRNSKTIATCDEGYYAEEEICKRCPNGQYSNHGSTSCSICPEGTYSNDKVIFCKNCPEGTFSKEGASECIECPDGTYSDIMGANSCKECPAGTKSYLGKSCIKCPKGSYSEKSGSSECAKCPKDTYSDNEGSSLCQNCPTGYCSDQGSSFCSKC